MVNPKFNKFLNKSIKKQLKKVISGDPIIRTAGSSEDQYKGLAQELEARFTAKTLEYQAHEYVHARIPLNNPYFSFMDFTTPVLNIKKKSIQGIATFNTVIPYPVNETYVLRSVGLSNKLIPHSLAIEMKIDPKRIIKEGMIQSKAIIAINKDKKLLKKLKGKTYCNVNTGISSGYVISIDLSKYPPGMFTVVPFYKHSILIAKDTGISLESCPNEPRYYFKDRYEALLGVAKYIAANPQVGITKGRFYLDKSMYISIHSILENIKKNVH
jgi:hypothetical protein